MLFWINQRRNVHYSNVHAVVDTYLIRCVDIRALSYQL